MFFNSHFSFRPKADGYVLAKHHFFAIALPFCEIGVVFSVLSQTGFHHFSIRP